MPLLYGYILNWGGYSSDAGSDSQEAQFRNALLKHKAFTTDKRGGRNPNVAWQSYWLKSSSALHDHGLSAKVESGELLANATERNTFTYPFMARVNSRNGTIIIVSTLYSITDAVVDQFNFLNTPNLQRKVVDVHKVSQALLDEKRSRDYSITYFLADVPGYGSNLRSITLYGNDIAEADFLRGERRNFSARKIGVRPFDGPFEAARFNNYGMVQFRSENIDIFEDFLRYAYRNELYIE